MTKLSVNINKIATLRNARGGNMPDLLQVAKDAQQFGAEGITIHPRPDERHIRYQDAFDLLKVVTTEYNIEGNPIPKFVDLVLQGHEHAYARMTQWEDGKRVPPVYTVSHCSPKFYRIHFDERFDRYGTGRQIYQHIAVHGDTLSMNAYDARTGKLYDRVDVVKGFHDNPTIIDRAKGIPEILDFTPQPGNKKDAAFAERIREYKAQKGLKP